MKKKYLIAILVVLVIAYAGYNYLYQDHRDIKTETPDFIVTSKNLSKEFANNANTAEQKYLNKTIQIEGNATEINTNDITIDDVVFCAFDIPIEEKIILNSAVKVKGRVIGYDDLLEQVKIDQTTLIK